MRFRKKPVEIEAMKLQTDNAMRVLHWAQGLGSGSAVFLGDPGSIEIDTLEGTMRADVGDWIIQGIAGEFYPCKPDIFAATYDPVPTPSHQSETALKTPVEGEEG